jgi:hypothetical protein
MLAVITIGWCLSRSSALAEVSSHGEHAIPRWLIHWIRFGIPTAIVAVGVWWVVTELLRVAAAA